MRKARIHRGASCAILSPDARKAKARAHSWKEPRAFCMLARIKASLHCLYACDTWRCPVLRAGGMKASEETYRLYSCRRCAEQVRICSDCDRGNQYCATECAPLRRRESLLRAGQRYQRSRRGACRHAARQRAWRERQMQKVTHQGSLPPAVPVTVAMSSIQSMPQGTHEDITSVEPRAQPHDTGRVALELAAPRGHAHWYSHRPARLPAWGCSFCGRALPPFARLDPLRGGA